MRDVIATWRQPATGPALDVRTWQRAFAAQPITVFVFEHAVDGLVQLEFSAGTLDRMLATRAYAYHDADERVNGWRMSIRCCCRCNGEIVNLALYHADSPTRFLTSTITLVKQAPRPPGCSRGHQTREAVRTVTPRGRLP